MKTNTYTVKGPKGVTLIELTVVIAVILLLISILFIGAQYFRNSANRSACVVNLTTMHKAVRSVQNIENSAVNANVDIVGAGLPLEVMPVCPAAGTYQNIDTTTGVVAVPAIGQAAVTCNFAGTEQPTATTDGEGHSPSRTDGW